MNADERFTLLEQRIWETKELIDQRFAELQDLICRHMQALEESRTHPNGE